MLKLFTACALGCLFVAGCGQSEPVKVQLVIPDMTDEEVAEWEAKTAEIQKETEQQALEIAWIDLRGGVPREQVLEEGAEFGLTDAKLRAYEQQVAAEK